MTSAGASPSAANASAAEHWHSLLRPGVELAPAYGEEFSARLRAARLTFGDRVHCPFLRPFFLSEDDEHRVRVIAELIAALGERVILAALEEAAGRAAFELHGLGRHEHRAAARHRGLARCAHLERVRDSAGAL